MPCCIFLKEHVYSWIFRCKVDGTHIVEAPGVAVDVFLLAPRWRNGTLEQFRNEDSCCSPQAFWLVRLLSMKCYIMLYQQTFRKQGSLYQELVNSVCRPFFRIKRFKSLANFGGFAVHQPNLEGRIQFLAKPLTTDLWGVEKPHLFRPCFCFLGGCYLCLKLPYLVNHHFRFAISKKNTFCHLLSQAVKRFFLPTKTTLPTKQRLNQVVGAAAATSCGATATDGGKNEKEGDSGPLQSGPKKSSYEKVCSSTYSPSYPFICAIYMGEQLHLFIWVISYNCIYI